MATEELEKGALVIVLEANRKPPRHCWGLVLKRFPSGNCEVQIGEGKYDNIIATPEQLIFVTNTKGNTKIPKKAVMNHIVEILLENTLISRTSRDFQILKRYKKMVEKRVQSRFRKGIARLLRRI